MVTNRSRMAGLLLSCRCYALPCACLLIVSACSEGRVSSQAPGAQTELLSLLDALEVKPSGTQPKIVKDAVVSVGVNFTDPGTIRVVDQGLERAAAKLGYNRSITQATEAEMHKTVCHGSVRNKYVRWTLLDGGRQAVLAIEVQRFAAALPKCAAPEA